MANVQIGWKVDVNSCISCRACEIACKSEFDIQAGQGRRRRVIEKTVEEFSTDLGKNVVRTFFTSLACNQCQNPACIAACPRARALPSDWDTNAPAKADYQANVHSNSWGKSALWKDVDGTSSNGVVGVVRVEDSTCIGCRRCEWACPYGAPQYNPETGKIHKCELCWERWGNTSMHISRRKPACVVQCLGQSIKADWVDTAAAAENTFTADDRENILSYGPVTGLLSGRSSAFENGTQGPTVYTAGPRFASPSASTPTGDPGENRGTKYVADASLTKPGLKIRNRVYVTRNGGGLE